MWTQLLPGLHRRLLGHEGRVGVSTVQRDIQRTSRTQDQPRICWDCWILEKVCFESVFVCFFFFFKYLYLIKMYISLIRIKSFLSATPNGEQDVETLAPPGSKKHSPNKLFEAEEVPCDICHGNKLKSVKSCLVCQASYCELHLTSHERDPALQRHRLTDPATFPSSHLCRNHNKPLTMFCRRDYMPVCLKCTERDHRQHETVPMERESRRVKVRKVYFIEQLPLNNTA